MRVKLKQSSCSAVQCSLDHVKFSGPATLNRLCFGPIDETTVPYQSWADTEHFGYLNIHIEDRGPLYHPATVSVCPAYRRQLDNSLPFFVTIKKHLLII
ncbi:Uncharacterized protein TCM_024830 [Theobroma cacao]|uniref:Uncharacterized protein n=1 Tax=Theobroma cacao TaxID=3641 RepID=A0A061EX71_THECC|nr:Uncharacterized protein TCM_024830 [Theobroma cacao]